MCRLHGSWSTAADHERTQFGENLAEKHYLLIFLTCTQYAMASHNAHYAFFIISTQEIIHGECNCLIMQGSCHQFARLVATLSLAYEVFIHLLVETLLVCFRLVPDISFVESARGIKRGRIDVEWDVDVLDDLKMLVV